MQIERTQDGIPKTSMPIPVDIHRRATAIRLHQKYGRKSGDAPTLQDVYIYLAYLGLHQIETGRAKPVFRERGHRPKYNFRFCRIGYPPELRAGIERIAERINNGEFERVPLEISVGGHSYTVSRKVSPRCVFITLIETGLKAT